MTGGTDLVLAAVALSNLLLLASSRLRPCIRVVAAQGVLVGLLPALAPAPGLRAALLCLVVIALKGLVFPRLLERAMQVAEVRREVEPFVGYPVSVLLGLLALGASFRVGARFPGLDAQPPDARVLSISLATLLTGLLVIVSRRKALSQVLGYLVVENGVYAFGLAMVEGVPLMLELGILLDVFAAVFVMGIVVCHISREFDHIDADRLNALKG